jgi:PEP-CTERM motif
MLRVGFFVSAAAVAGLLTATAPASATLYDWTLTGGGDYGSGTLVTGAPDNGGVDILSFSGTIDGNPVTLLGGQPGGATATSLFVYDNILYPPPNDPVLDVWGVLFSDAGDEGNIFYGITPLDYSYWSAPLDRGGDSTTNNSVTFTLTADLPDPIPEPTSLALFGVGLAGLGFARYRRRDQGAATGVRGYPRKLGLTVEQLLRIKATPENRFLGRIDS